MRIDRRPSVWAWPEGDRVELCTHARASSAASMHPHQQAACVTGRRPLPSVTPPLRPDPRIGPSRSPCRSDDASCARLFRRRRFHFARTAQLLRSASATLSSGSSLSLPPAPHSLLPPSSTSSLLVVSALSRPRPVAPSPPRTVSPVRSRRPLHTRIHPPRFLPVTFTRRRPSQAPPRFLLRCVESLVVSETSGERARQEPRGLQS